MTLHRPPHPPGEAPPEATLTSAWRQRLHTIIFEADTRAGKNFDVFLLFAILASVFVVLIDSVPSVHAEWHRELYAIEWIFTVIFTVEYVLRLLSVRSPLRYARSFYGMIDLLSVLPTWLSLVMPGAQTLLVVRAFRLMRVFRIFKLGHFVGAAEVLMTAIHASARKIFVFVTFVLIVVLIVGSMMYLLEPPESGFTSIPQSIYWAIVTMTTVGYGDVAPTTVLGKMLASALMIVGYGVIAVPTGIVTVELAKISDGVSTQACPACGADGHATDATFCRICGSKL